MPCVAPLSVDYSERYHHVVTRDGDWDLVEAAQRGDRDAFGRLWVRRAPGVRQFALRRTRDPWLADDVTSETFTRAWQAIGSVTYQGYDVSTWLLRIAHRIIMDHWKSARYRREMLVAGTCDFSDEDGLWKMIAWMVGRLLIEFDVNIPEQAAIDKETVRKLGKAITRLTPGQRECVRSRFLDELSVAETATRMGRHEGAIKTLTRRALAALRVALSGKGLK